VVKTTIEIDDAILTAARELATCSERSLSQVVEDALRQELGMFDRDALYDERVTKIEADIAAAVERWNRRRAV
jgi:Arc/MetJ family transcription regulator